jgi:hypothetical protein
VTDHLGCFRLHQQAVPTIEVSVRQDSHERRAFLDKKRTGKVRTRVKDLPDVLRAHAVCFGGGLQLRPA